MMKQCLECHQEYNAGENRQIYCSKTCAGMAHNSKVRAMKHQQIDLPLKCSTCDNEFETICDMCNQKTCMECMVSKHG